MLIKYIIILYLITPDSNYSLSIREDIEFAVKYLKYHGISDEKVCTKDNIKNLCSNEQKELCSARVLNKKMEFKQFENPCYMDLDNLCESQDNIWAIKNAGPCIMNADLRRYAKEIEKMADTDTQTETNNDTTTDQATGPDNTDTTTDATETVTENDETGATTDETTDENIETESTADDTESTTDETEITDTTIDGDETETNANLRMGEEIGKVFYDDGSEKVLRAGPTIRFPPMKGKWVYGRASSKINCTLRIKPCPIIYYPVCLYHKREEPNNATYYYFINLCEAQQWSCYHPERKVDGPSSIRAGYCAHIQFINYARYAHTMSAWNHYGWLHGSGPISRILRPNQRA